LRIYCLGRLFSVYELTTIVDSIELQGSLILFDTQALAKLRVSFKIKILSFF